MFKSDSGSLDKLIDCRGFFRRFGGQKSRIPFLQSSAVYKSITTMPNISYANEIILNVIVCSIAKAGMLVFL